MNTRRSILRGHAVHWLTASILRKDCLVALVVLMTLHCPVEWELSIGGDRRLYVSTFSGQFHVVSAYRNTIPPDRKAKLPLRYGLGDLWCEVNTSDTLWRTGLLAGGGRYWAIWIPWWLSHPAIVAIVGIRLIRHRERLPRSAFPVLPRERRKDSTRASVEDTAT